ncbi:hypothetical protein LTR28_010986, partial [Elasticomyces elasticus]
MYDPFTEGERVEEEIRELAEQLNGLVRPRTPQPAVREPLTPMLETPRFETTM